MRLARLSAQILTGIARAAHGGALWVLAAYLVVVGLAAHYTVNHLGVDTDMAALLSPELPFRQAQERTEAAFPQYAQAILVVVDGPTPESAQRAAAALSQALARQEDRFSEVFHAGSLPFFARHGLLFKDREALATLSDELAEAQPLLARLMADASLQNLFTLLAEASRQGDELDVAQLETVYRSLTASLQQGRTAAFGWISWQELLRGETAAGVYREFVPLQPILDYQRLDAAGPALAAVERTVAELELAERFGVRVRMTGNLALSHDELQTVVMGAQWLGVMALVLVSLVLWWGLGSLRLVLVALLTLVVGLVLTAGFASVAVGHLNMISVAFAVLYIGLGADFAIHFLLRFRELRADGWARPAAVKRAAAGLSGTLGLCALSTSIGFYAFVPTAFLGVAELGLIAGSAMLIGLLVSFSLMPALLRWLAPAAVPATPVQLPGQALLAHGVRYSRGVRYTALGLGVAAVAILPWLQFDYNPLNLRAQDSDSVATLNALLDAGEAGPWTVTALAANADEAERLTKALAALPSVAQTLTIDDFVPANQDAKLALIADLPLLLGPTVAYAPVTRTDHDMTATLAALDEFVAALQTASVASAPSLRQALEVLVTQLQQQTLQGRARTLAELERHWLGHLPFVVERLQTSLEAGPVSMASLPAALRDRWLNAAGTYRVAITPAADLRERQALQTFVKQVRQVAPQASGSPILFQASGEAVVSAFQQALLLALAGVSLVVYLALRQWRLTLVVLTPLVLGGALTGAGMVLFGIDFNFANVIALPLLLGVSVDSGVHIVQRWRAGVPPAQILRSSTARGVLFSALTTVMSFGNLAFSPHPGTASLGLVLTLGMLATVLSTLVVLPALLQRWQPESAEVGQAC